MQPSRPAPSGIGWGAGGSPPAGESGTADRATGSLEIWSGGAIEVGTRDRTTGRSKLSFTTSGLSSGMDIKLGEDLIVGAGGGYGGSRTDIGETLGRLDSSSWVGVAYGSLRPGKGAFVDAVAGIGGLDLDTRRTAANGQLATGSRSGSMRFGSLAVGYDGGVEAWRLSAYLRAEYLSASLDEYIEAGAGLYNLRYGRLDVESLSGTGGLRTSVELGAVTPRAQFEWRHEFSGASDQRLDYADLTGLTYRIQSDDQLRDEFSLELGFGVELGRGWTFGTDFGGRIGRGFRSGVVRGTISAAF
ncbi:MAG: autotransporter outer membrane beta-barrel domain-containing protein [Sphingomonas sp.]